MDVLQEADLLRKVPIFGGLDPARLKLLAFTSRAVKFGPGETIVRINEPSDSAYVIIEGEAEILDEANGGEVILDQMGRNEIIGEQGVLLNAPRSATVRAKTAVRALRISSDVFLSLLTDNPDCALHVMRELSTRVKEANARFLAVVRKG
jgi:CRP-like cAMP-binding protein